MAWDSDVFSTPTGPSGLPEHCYVACLDGQRGTPISSFRGATILSRTAVAQADTTTLKVKDPYKLSSLMPELHEGDARGGFMKTLYDKYHHGGLFIQRMEPGGVSETRESTNPGAMPVLEM